MDFSYLQEYHHESCTCSFSGGRCARACGSRRDGAASGGGAARAAGARARQGRGSAQGARAARTGALLRVSRQTCCRLALDHCVLTSGHAIAMPSGHRSAELASCLELGVDIDLDTARVLCGRACASARAHTCPALIDNRKSIAS